MIRLKILYLAFILTTILNAVLILTYIYWYLTTRTFFGSRFFYRRLRVVQRVESRPLQTSFTSK